MRGTKSARSWAVLGLTAALVLAVVPAALAQTDVTTSRISGTVRDIDGAALPGVIVEGKNEATGLVQTATSRTDGFYQLVNLPTGSYSLTATLSGFRSESQSGVRVDINVVPNVNFRLQLEKVTASVTVTASTPRASKRATA